MGFIRYTCAKKKCQTSREECKSCESYNPCVRDGNWCFVGALTSEYDSLLMDSKANCCEDAAAPLLVDTSTVTINLGDGQTMQVLKSDIEEAIKRQLFKGIALGLTYGA